MSMILGLDLGTNSIGWAVVERRDGVFHFPEANGHPTKGVIIFPEGAKIETKTGSIKSRAAERTGYRGARRLKFRRKLRKYQTLLVLARNGMCPLTVDEVKTWRNSNFKKYPSKDDFLNWLRTDDEKNINPYFFRDKFLRVKYDWENDRQLAYELGRTFYHIAQRRGFKSNRLEQSDENIISDAKDEIQDVLNDVKNSAELYDIIQYMYIEGDLKNKTKDDLDATQQKIKTILNYIIRVLSNKIKDKDCSTFEKAKSEIDRYINKPENLGTVKGGIKELSEEIEKAGCKTLGQYFWHLYQQDRHDANNKIRNRYTAREEHYLEEFDLICHAQKIGSINKKYSLKSPVERYSGLASALYKAIFYQRPLKSQKGLVGKCTFERNKPRCPVSRPEFEEFRMWQFINNIKIKIPSDEKLRSLTWEEKDKIVPRFYLQKATFKMRDLAETLFGKEQVNSVNVAYTRDRDAKKAPCVINFKLNTTVPGNPVSAAFKSLMGDDWKTKIYTYQTTNGKGEIVQRTVDYKDLWHVLFTFEDTQKLKEYADQKLGLDQDASKKFTKISLQQGYANLSLKAINKILPWLEKGLIYPHAVFMANLDNVVDEKIWKNPDERKKIEEGISAIIDSRRDESRKTIAVNSLIKRYKREKGYSPGESDLESKLKEIYGAKTWEDKEDRDTFFNDACELLKGHLNISRYNETEFVRIKRTDERVKEFLLGNNPTGEVYCSDEASLNKHLYHPSDLETFKPKKAKDKDGNEIEILPLPKTDAIKNPVLMRAMHQLRKLINELLHEGIIDDETRIHIELAREMNDANRRKAWKQWQDKLRDENEEIEQIIRELFREQGKKDIIESDDIKKVKAWSEQLRDNKDQLVNVFELSKNKKDLIEKYKLWKEQKGRCLYTGKSISLAQLFNGISFDIEHTIPRSRSWDNSMMNKTVADAAFNRNTKGNKIPFELGIEKYEEILQRNEEWKTRYEKLDNEIKSMNPSRILDPKKRNSKIVDKHIKTFERDYWKGKYERFVIEEVPEGFKNSQTTDTGLITRFAKNYLSCLFRRPNGNRNVRVINGIAVDQFRRAWGLQEEYEKKSRTNHIHHCIDAVTIACMTKRKYDAFAEEWRKAEEEAKYDVKEKLGKYKPWPTFTQDVLNLEDEVLVVHTSKDNVPKQTKKKEKKRGRIVPKIIYEKDGNGNIILDKDGKKKIKEYVYAKDKLTGKKIPIKGKKLTKDEAANKQEGTDYFVVHKNEQEKYYEFVRYKKTGKIVYKKQPVYLKGDTVRGSLHKETFYGAIARDKDGNVNRDEEGNIIPNYVVRKELSKLRSTDVKNIVDKNIREIIEHAVKNKIISFNKNGAKVSKTVWQNEEKQIPIKKVRVYTPSVKSPLMGFKTHAKPFLSKKPYKQQFNVVNDENYCMAIYEGKKKNGKIDRASDLVNNTDAGEYYRLSNKNHRKQYPIVPETHKEKGYPLKMIIRKGQMVLLYDKSPDEVWKMPNQDKMKRLYEITQLDTEGQSIKLMYHQEARQNKEITKHMGLRNGMKGGKLIDQYKEFPWIKVSPNQFDALVEGIDFEITPAGEINRLK